MDTCAMRKILYFSLITRILPSHFFVLSAKKGNNSLFQKCVVKLWLCACFTVTTAGVSANAIAGTIEHFAKISNERALNDSECGIHGGRDIVGKEYEYLIKAVPKNVSQVGIFSNTRSFNGKIYVIYGVRKSSFSITTSIGICQF